MAKEAKRTKKVKPGTKPQAIKIDGDWEAAVDKALQKKRPLSGWPKFKKDPKK